jgi:hypothetical protein
MKGFYQRRDITNASQKVAGSAPGGIIGQGHA